MLHLRVTVVKFSDGSHSLYFLDGKRDHDIQSEDQLLDKIVGRTLQYVERIWITNPDESNPEPWEDLWYAEREEELYAKLEHHPEMEDR